MSSRKQKPSTARTDAYREREKAAGGRRLEVVLSAHAVQGLDRWKAYSGARTDKEAVELAILEAIMAVRK